MTKLEIPTEEIWKDIPEFEGLYQASNLGNLKALPKTAFHNLTNRYILRKEKLLRNNSVNTGGYKQVFLRKNGIFYPSRVHRLVASTFIPNLENKKCVNHKNGIKTDNRVVNLEWATHSENEKHAFSIGIKVNSKGEKHPRAVLNQEAANIIRSKYIKGKYGRRILAKEFNVGTSTIWRIVNNKNYLPTW